MPSISRRITAILAAVCILGAGLTTISISYVVDHEMDELLDQGLRESADLIHNVISRAPTSDGISREVTTQNEYEEHLIWQLVDLSTLKVVAKSSHAPSQPMVTAYREDLFDLDNKDTGAHWRVITLAAKLQGQYLLSVAQSHEERAEARAEAPQYAALMTLLSALLTTGLMYYLIRRELRRLKEVSESVSRYDPLVPGAHVGNVDRKELRPIVEAVEGLGQRLASRVVSERAFTSHAAHALRTPLSGLEVQLAIALRESSEDPVRNRLMMARTAVSRLSSVVHALLAMFRSGMEPNVQEVKLRELIDSVSLPELAISISGDAVVRLDADLFAAVLMNLFDNAKRHGATSVSIQSSRIGRDYEISVSDNGTGCPSERVSRMQEALDRQDYQTGSGLTGLGLILADLILRAHGGRVLLEPRSGSGESTRGFGIRMRWPR